jgi:5'-phosphate synthase pdxT subunit
VRLNAFGRQVDSFESEVDFEGIEGGPLHGVFIRAPWVEKVGADVEVLATATGGLTPARAMAGAVAGADGETARIVAVRQRHVLATSFHPEITGDLRVHRYFVDMVRDAV